MLETWQKWKLLGLVISWLYNSERTSGLLILIIGMLVMPLTALNRSSKASWFLFHLRNKRKLEASSPFSVHKSHLEYVHTQLTL